MHYFLNKRKDTVRHPRGFTLVETLVSTMIITLVILGPLTLASNASTYARVTKDTLIATYLAQEAIELLRHQQDSVYIRCIQSISSVCVLSPNETSEEGAWRIFKARLGTTPQGASCYLNENANGCSYDVLDMARTQDGNPTKYISTLSSCSTLSTENSTGLYVCTGVHGTGPGFTLTGFSRIVSVTSIPTITTSDQAYNDDLRVTVTVKFKRVNGYTRQIKVIDFLHARA